MLIGYWIYISQAGRTRNIVFDLCDTIVIDELHPYNGFCLMLKDFVTHLWHLIQKSQYVCETFTKATVTVLYRLQSAYQLCLDY